jgi:hypothetical protein
MFSEAAPDCDWTLADNQMPDRQIAAQVVRREKTISFPLSGPSDLLPLDWSRHAEHVGSQRQPSGFS